KARRCRPNLSPGFFFRGWMISEAGSATLVAPVRGCGHGRASQTRSLASGIGYRDFSIISPTAKARRCTWRLAHYLILTEPDAIAHLVPACSHKLLDNYTAIVVGR